MDNEQLKKIDAEINVYREMQELSESEFARHIGIDNKPVKKPLQFFLNDKNASLVELTESNFKFISEYLNQNKGGVPDKIAQKIDLLKKLRHEFLKRALKYRPKLAGLYYKSLPN